MGDDRASWKWLWLWLTALALAIPPLAGQRSSDPSAIRVTTRLVDVRLVARDDHDAVVSDLTRSDFRIASGSYHARVSP